MTINERMRNHEGFTLVEILIVMAMLGLVVTAMLSLYQNTQRQAYTQEEVVEVQQNLRIALDQIVRDIRLAGFMIPTDQPPISDASSDTLTFNTASTFGRVARIAQNYTLPGSISASTTADIVIGLGDMADLFESDQKVRVIRPPNHSEVLVGAVDVEGKDRDVPKIILDGFAAGDINRVIQAGDLIVRIPSASAATPDTITYSLDGTDLKRIVNLGVSGQDTQVVANRITGLTFRYLKDNDSTTLHDSVPSAELGTIRAVQVELTGATNQMGSTGVKTRAITNVVTIRNR
jgi:prepilin-type N-terminal cleavage/methylation domain-containing protein